MEQGPDISPPSETEDTWTWERVFKTTVDSSSPELDRDIRIALQLLVVSGRPVSLAEIKSVILLDQKREDAVSAILDLKESNHLAKSAETEIPELLGPLIDIVEDKSTKVARLADSSLSSLLTSPESAKLNPWISKYAFSIEYAHRQIAKLCMLLCQRATLYHANLFGPNRLPLVEYAWEYWAYHLHFATSKIERLHELENFFGTMITTVSKDTVTYLDALCSFLSNPLPSVPGRFSDLEYVVSLRRAQKVVLEPISDITKLRNTLSPSLSVLQRLGILEELENTRKALPGPLEPTSPANPPSDNVAALNAQSGILRSLKWKSSAVSRVQLDDLLDKSNYINKPTGVSKILLDIARHLRILTLRLAVDPVYSALILSAGGKSFSPLHILIYTAQLFEQCGSFPYWSRLGTSVDPIESFRCSPEDPEYAPSKFVLFHFEWREQYHPNNSQSTAGRYVRLNQLRVESSPHMNQLARILTEYKKQIERLHNKTGPQYYKELAFYSLVKQRENAEDIFASMFRHPLAVVRKHYHQILEDLNQDSIFQASRELLATYIPQKIRDEPIARYLLSFPSLLNVIFVHWTIYIRKACRRIPGQVMALHATRLEVAKQEFGRAGGFFQRFWKAFVKEKSCLWYLILGLSFFGLRCLYMPNFGAFHLSHSWAQFTWAWTQPASYLTLESWSGVLGLFSYIFRVVCDTSLAFFATALTQTKDVNNALSFLGHSYRLFHYLCSVERGIFGVLTTGATLLSCARIIMEDPTSLAVIFRAGIFYWVNVWFGFYIAKLQMKWIEADSFGSRSLATPIHISDISGLILFVYQAERIIRWTSYLLAPVTAPVKFFRNTFTQHSVPLAQLIGIGTTIGLCGLALYWMHQVIWDPFSTNASLRQLRKASRLARSTLSQENYLRIGEAPLGDATESELAQQRPTNDSNVKDSAPMIQEIKEGEKIKEA